MFDDSIDGDGNQIQQTHLRRKPSVTSAAEPVKVKPPAAVAVSLLNCIIFSGSRNQIRCIIFF